VLISGEVSVRVCFACAFRPPPFVDQGERGRVTRVGCLWGHLFSPLIWGRTVGCPCHQMLWSMASGVVVVLANPLAVPRARPCPMAPVISMMVTTERTEPALDVVGRRGRRSPWPCPGQEPYRVRGSSPMPAEGPAGEKSTRVGGTVSRWCQASPHRAPRRE